MHLSLQPFHSLEAEVILFLSVFFHLIVHVYNLLCFCLWHACTNFWPFYELLFLPPSPHFPPPFLSLSLFLCLSLPFSPSLISTLSHSVLLSLYLSFFLILIYPLSLLLFISSLLSLSRYSLSEMAFPKARIHLTRKGSRKQERERERERESLPCFFSILQPWKEKKKLGCSVETGKRQKGINKIVGGEIKKRKRKGGGGKRILPQWSTPNVG